VRLLLFDRVGMVCKRRAAMEELESFLQLQFPITSQVSSSSIGNCETEDHTGNHVALYHSQ
jgi:hypothetical protein